MTRSTPPTKVAYVTMQFPAPSETFAVNDVRSLLRQGASVSVFAMRTRHEHHDEMTHERSIADVRIEYLSTSRLLRGILLALLRPRWSWPLLGRVVGWSRGRPEHLAKSLALLPSALACFDDVRRGRFDVVHLFWGHYPTMVGYLVDRFLPGTVLSMFLGAYDLFEEYGGSAAVAPHADLVWTHARANVSSILDLGVAPERLHVAYRGVELRRFAAPTEHGPSQRIPHRIVTAARLVPDKHVEHVLYTMSTLVRRFPEASLHLLGGGPHRRVLEALVKELRLEQHVRFLGHVSHEQVLAEMSSAEVFLLLSSAEERISNAAKEAVASGCICVLTETPGVDELIEHGVTGFIVEPGDLEAAADSVEQVFAGAVDTGRMREAAFRHLAAHFDVDVSMALYLERWRSEVENESAAAGVQRPSATS